MRTGAASETLGYFHELALYGSDEELLDVVVPFLQGGIDAGEPTLVTFAPHNASLVRRVFGDHSGLVFLPGADQYARPAVAIRSYQQLMTALVSEGAQQIRIVGDVPHTGTGGDWDEWVRYEAAVNEAFDEFPLWGLCPYDTRTAPPQVIVDVLATHPHIATSDGHRHNPQFADPRAALAGRRPTPPVRGPADRALMASTTAEARREATGAALDAGLDAAATERLVVVTSELVANGLLHGRLPVTVELWSSASRVDIAVSDAGPGPADPLVGLTDPGDVPSGRGLWIAHQFCTSITLDRHPHGFTVRATVRNEP